jgi:hypothetical protein
VRSYDFWYVGDADNVDETIQWGCSRLSSVWPNVLVHYDPIT